MKARVRIVGINTPEEAKELFHKILEAKLRAKREGRAKRSFIESAEREEAKNILTGFSQA